MPAPRAPQQAPDQGPPPLFAAFFNGEPEPPAPQRQPQPGPSFDAQRAEAVLPRLSGQRRPRRDSVRRINPALELQEVPRPPRPSLAPRAPKPKRPAPPRKLTPCPADAERHRLSVWDARGWLPDGVAPSSVAAAYRRAFGTEPRRDLACHTFRAYSLRELGHALGELGRAFEPEPLRKVWDRALQRVALPSTRTLFAQQARLMEVRGPVGMTGGLFVVVAVASDWLEAVKIRRRLLSDALADALGQPVAMALREVEQ